ncbi:MAG: hypothetical protein EBY11_12380, partial [Proteobacteria bacterium]|nr:hypothetical protein [Pseudomonadota bacterium]
MRPVNSRFLRSFRTAIAVALAVAAIVITSRTKWEAVATTGVTISPATGGQAISLDGTTDGGTASCTSLVGPVVTEQASGDIASGTMSLTPPAGFEFCQGGTASVSAVGLSTTLALGSSAVTRDPSGSVSIAVSSASTGNSVGRISFAGLSVRPTNRFPATGNISIGGQSIPSPLAGGGFLSSVPGSATAISHVSGSFADGTVRSSVATITLQIIDQFGNVRTNDSSTQVILGLVAANSTLVDPSGTSYGEYLNCQGGRVAMLAAGVATWSQCVVTRSGSAWRLQATSAGLPTWTSTSVFTTSPVAPSSLAYGTASANFGYINLVNVAAVPAVVGFPAGGVIEPGVLTVVLSDRFGRTATGVYAVPVSAQGSQNVEGLSIDASSLADGPVTSTVKFVSTIGSQSSPVVAGSTLTRDTVPPLAPDISKLTVSNNLPAVADGLTGTSGAVEASATVSAFGSEPSSSTIALSMAQADASGAFPTVSLGLNGETAASGTFGVSGVYVTASDAAGNRGASSFIAINRDANPMPQSARVRLSGSTYDVINASNFSSVSVEVSWSSAPEAGSLVVCLSDTTRPATGTFDLCAPGSQSWGVSSSTSVAAGSPRTVVVTGIPVTSLTSGRIGVQVRHTDLAGNTKGEFTGVSAVRDVATSDPTATSIRVKSGPSNDQDEINLASQASVYVDVGFAAAPAETGLLSVRLTSSGNSG